MIKGNDFVGSTYKEKEKVISAEKNKDQKENVKNRIKEQRSFKKIQGDVKRC